MITASEPEPEPTHLAFFLSPDGQRGRIWTDGTDNFKRLDDDLWVQEDRCANWRIYEVQVATMKGHCEWADEGESSGDFLLRAGLDAKIWAAEFCKITGFADEETAFGWFANAIMAGVDRGMPVCGDQMAARIAYDANQKKEAPPTSRRIYDLTFAEALVEMHTRGATIQGNIAPYATHRCYAGKKERYVDGQLMADVGFQDGESAARWRVVSQFTRKPQ